MAGKTWKKTKVQFLWQHRKYGTYYARFHRDGKQHRKSLKTDVFGSPKRRSPHTSKTFDRMRQPPKPYPTICVRRIVDQTASNWRLQPDARSKDSWMLVTLLLYMSKLLETAPIRKYQLTQ